MAFGFLRRAPAGEMTCGSGESWVATCQRVPERLGASGRGVWAQMPASVT